MSQITSPPAPEVSLAAQPPRAAGNGLGIASLVLGIVTMAGFAIPVLNVGGIGTGIVGLALGIIGLIVKMRNGSASRTEPIWSKVGGTL